MSKYSHFSGLLDYYYNDENGDLIIGIRDCGEFNLGKYILKNIKFNNVDYPENDNITMVGSNKEWIKKLEKKE